ncbi:hypothetical protein Scep_000570 [Stephania cephalantha]|uniref:Kinesin-like protein KIN-7D, mitochondrial n=1 Tax=Stephania cephalantha TaxID=152367 RepID=A0AAP0LA34_9MAGN
MAASSSRGRSSSPFGYRKPTSSPYSSNSSTASSSLMNGRSAMPRSCSSSASSFYASANGFSTKSITPSRSRTGIDSVYRGSRNRTPVPFPSAEDLIGAETVDTSRSGDSISVTVRFRPLSEREFQRGDEIAWYADGDKIVRSEYNPATAYAFDRVFGPSTNSQTVYDVAARPVVKAAMEGVNGTVFAYGVTSSGKTHTMHGDQNSPGIIPLAIKDVFSIIQDTPGREFLLRVSYLEIYNEVINDLLDPTGQNLRVREDAQGTYVEGIKEEVVLSPGHALSFIAAGEEHRHVGSNNFNLFSSRSHTIFTLMIESSVHGDEYDGVIFSQLNLIDLAGSESSKTETTGLRRKEGSYINKSLLTLGTVIGKLSEGKASHVPYRDSKLTRLLQSSLSGRGHVSLICTVTPASSNMEETHNTVKFASRAKRVEIFASRNRIIDEKSLIKKYQREISSLKEELDQLKQGMLAGINHEEIISLRQKLEEGQVKMQSRLEEEEEAKAALMSRIQRLTKLILVSSKTTISGRLSDTMGHQHRNSLGEDDKSDALYDASPLLGEVENQKHSPTSALSLPGEPLEARHRRSSSKWNEDQSTASSTVTESAQGGITISDEMDLLVEQVKMLAGEIAFSTSTLKRLMDQSINDPDGFQSQIQNLEKEIQEKRRQMKILEKRIVESGEASVASASLVDMQQTIAKLMTQCSEKDYELEIKSADNRVLQDQLQTKCAEIKELQEKIQFLQQQLASAASEKSSPSSDQCAPEETFELKKKIQSQVAYGASGIEFLEVPLEFDNEKLRLEHVQLMEENSGLRVQNQKLAEEASYAKELASAAAVELKNLAGEVTKLSMQNARQAKELLAAHDIANSRGIGMQASNGASRKYSESKMDGMKHGRKARLSGRGNGISDSIHEDADYWNLDPDDLKMELQARKQREAALEAALAEKELVEEEFRKQVDEAKKREASLENDLASMWVLVAKLKKEGPASDLNVDERAGGQADLPSDDTKSFVGDATNDYVKEVDVPDNTKSVQGAAELDPLVVRLKARVQEMKEKQLETLGNGDTNSHVCKVCFESPTAALLLPCRHFCLCKPCSLACIECPLCRSRITDRIFAFPS